MLEKDFSVTIISYAHSRVSDSEHHLNLYSNAEQLQNFISAFMSVLETSLTRKSFRTAFSFSET
jgi:hypothetical protein